MAEERYQRLLVLVGGDHEQFVAEVQFGAVAGNLRAPVRLVAHARDDERAVDQTGNVAYGASGDNRILQHDRNTLRPRVVMVAVIRGRSLPVQFDAEKKRMAMIETMMPITPSG